MMSTSMETLPMFPLGLVAFPGSVIPLRLFEPRYLEMYRHLREGDGEFGIVLIERGTAEARGGEHFSVGSVVKLVGSAPLEDDTIIVMAVGTQRLRVIEWLEDDPYPRAVIERMEEPWHAAAIEAGVERCRRLLTRVLLLASELGADVGDPEPEINPNPLAAMYEIARIAPLQEMDQQRILESDDAPAAVAILEEELEGVIQLLELQLGAE